LADLGGKGRKGATLFGPFSIVTAHNLTLLVVMALNGFCTYVLAGRVTTDQGARIVAGVVFATSAAITIRLLGHFNLTCAFVLPLFAIVFPRAVQGSISLPTSILTLQVERAWPRCSTRGCRKVGVIL